MINRQRDRVNVQYDRSINVGNYESVKIGVGYASDVRKGETPTQAFERAEKFASKKLDELALPFEGVASKPATNKNRRK